MPSDPTPPPESRRTLGAIVFTDVANFTRRVTQDEALTLGLVRRDLEMMGRYCAKFDGRVIKSTGDGLLMYFSSAVQAVACAVKVQRILSDSAKKLPADQILKHRIGIHLGDVFLSETDVLGDGVNIAARLQQQAEPGGICFSQTVYDVVKNRFGLKTTYVGPTELKHIREKIPVYKVITDASAGAPVDAPPPPVPDAPAPARGGGRHTVLAFAGGGALVLAGLVVGVLVVGGARNPTPQRPATDAGEVTTPAPPTDGDPAPNPPALDRPDANASAAETATAILHRFDRNGDGMLSREELPRRRGDDVMRRADRDGNGRLTLDEIQEAAQIMEVPPRRREGERFNRPWDEGHDRPRPPALRGP